MSRVYIVQRAGWIEVGPRYATKRAALAAMRADEASGYTVRVVTPADVHTMLDVSPDVAAKYREATRPQKRTTP